MKKFTHVVLLCSLLLVALLPAHANSIAPVEQAAEEGEGIAFIKDKTFDELLAMAKAEGKLLFVDCFTTWCGPCKWLDANVFNQAEVGEYFDEHFLAAKFDMEKGEGLELAKRYGIQAYPTMIFVNGDGELQHRICGSSPVEQFMDRVAGALDEENRLGTLMARYDSGDRDPAFLGNYLEVKSNGCMKVEDTELAAYWETQTEEDYLSTQNWKIYQQHVNSMEDPMFQYMLANEQAFYDAHGEEAVKGYQFGVVNRSLQVAKREGEEAYSALHDKLAASGHEACIVATLFNDFSAAANAGDIDAAYTAVDGMVAADAAPYLGVQYGYMTAMYIISKLEPHPTAAKYAGVYEGIAMTVPESQPYRFQVYGQVAELYYMGGNAEKGAKWVAKTQEIAGENDDLSTVNGLAEKYSD